MKLAVILALAMAGCLSAQDPPGRRRAAEDPGRRHRLRRQSRAQPPQLHLHSNHSPLPGFFRPRGVASTRYHRGAAHLFRTPRGLQGARNQRPGLQPPARSVRRRFFLGRIRVGDERNLCPGWPSRIPLAGLVHAARAEDARLRLPGSQGQFGLPHRDPASIGSSDGVSRPGLH